MSASTKRLQLLSAGLLMVVAGLTAGVDSVALADDNSPGRVLSFPTSRSMGALMSRPPQVEENGRWPNYEGWESIGPAQGNVRIPSGHQVRLDVGVSAVSDLSPLGELPPDALVTIRIEDAKIDDDQLASIGRLAGLIELVIESSTITDAGLRHLSNLHQLREIDLDAYGVRDDGFGTGDAGAEMLSRLKSLERIGLRKARLTDIGLAHLARMPTLRSLELSGTQITDAGLASLSKTRSLEVLSLGVYDDGCSVTDAGITRLADLPRLRWLRLNSTGLTDKGLAALSRLETLEYLVMGGTKVTVRGLEGLSTLKRLETIEVPFDIDDRAAHALARIPSLRRIRSNLDEITDDGLRALAKLDDLQWFDVSSEFVTDEGMRAIGRMKNLKLLGLSNCRVSDAGFVHLRSLENLEILRVRLPQFRGPGLRFLSGLQKLTDLRLNMGSDHDSTEPRLEVDLSSLNALQSVTDLSLSGDRLERKHIAGAFELSRLKSLRIDFSVNDLDLERLSGIDSLEILEVDDHRGRGSEVTDAGLGFLSTLPRLKWLSLTGLFTGQGLQDLTRVRSLENLFLASPFLTEGDINRMQKSLPNLVRFRRGRMGTDPATLTAVRAAVSQAGDPESVLAELDRIDVSLNTRDLIFRDGNRAARAEINEREEKPAPPLTIDRWVDKRTSLEDLHGKIVLVWFTSARVSNFRRHLPLLQKLEKQLGRFGFEIVGVHRSKYAATMDERVRAFGITWPVGADRNDATFKAWGVDDCWPAFVLVDRQGIVRFIDVKETDLQRAVRKLVLESPDRSPKKAD